ncbi:MAG: DUF5985 family protein [Chthoniobacteraceae bacterium]
MQQVIYILCGLTSLLCAILLFRGHARTGLQLLFWSGMCFGAVTITNALLFIDLVIYPQGDLRPWRSGVTLVAYLMLLYGLIVESK